MPPFGDVSRTVGFQLGAGVRFASVLHTLLAFATCLSVFPAPSSAGSVLQTREGVDTEGLYYLQDDLHDGVLTALVITVDGGAIPPKANDPDAPTQPGFYVSEKRFALRAFSVSMRRVSFRTVNVDGVSYSFDGKVEREDVETIEDVPVLTGTLIKRMRERIVERRKVRFGHAVIL